MPSITKNQTKLGVLGGMGPEATNAFYGRVIARTDAACDQEHVPAVILNDCTLPDRTAALKSGDTAELLCRLQEDAKSLQALGCTAIAIPCNTSHALLADIQAAVDIPVLNMVEETVARLTVGGTYGLLATEGTVAGGLYQQAGAARGVTLVVPPEEVQAEVTRLIYDVVKAGQPGDVKDFFPIANAMRAMKCQGMVLACTELSVFRLRHNLPDCVDAMECLAEASILACGKSLRSFAGARLERERG